MAGRAMRNGECTISGMASSMFDGAGSRANGSQPTTRPSSTSAVKAPQWASWGKRATVMAGPLPVAGAGDEPFSGGTQLGPDGHGDGIQWYIGQGLQYAEAEPCEIFATLCIYLNRAILPNPFSVAMSPNPNKWGTTNGGRKKRRGGFMHQSTWVVLLLLMFGEIAILALGGFILWLAG